MIAELPSLRRRAQIHAALGDPARLAIVDRLILGDASPGEIAHDLGMATNLVAHHVNVLMQAALIDRRRSEGDRRRTYLRLQPAALAGLTAAHLDISAGRVVFVCTHNSARSQLAAALWRQRTGRPVASAGTRPAARVHPRALTIAHRHGLRLDPTGTAHVTDILRPDDLVIAVCDNAYEDLAADTGAPDVPRRVPPRLHWSVPDPVRVDTDAAFEAAYADLDDRITRLAPTFTSGADHD
jgi:protein-tyrosine-phosphatase/DNA-binding transcriptional ArsR family regulator